MITYLYETIPQHPGEKPEQFTLRQSIKDAPLTRHPMGGAPVRRVIQPNALLRSMRRVVAPLSSGGDCCGPEGGTCHH